jgi:predicted RNA binding protein YcfA (HicA-like mRNA interferase family)
MPPKIRKLKADLQRAGFYSQSGKGSHVVFRHSADPFLRVTIAGRHELEIGLTDNLYWREGTPT